MGKPVVYPKERAIATGLDLYRQGLLWASGVAQHPFPLDGAVSEEAVQLAPLRGHPAALYRVHMLGPWQEIHPGWLSGQVWLNINGQVGNRLPITFYTDTPTDWATGVARFLMPCPYADPQRREYADVDTVWLLALRRFA